MTHIIDGKYFADTIKEEVQRETEHLKQQYGIVPGLAVILVGENPASQAYVRTKEKVATELGFYSFTNHQPATLQEHELLSLINMYNNDPRIHGILVQLPLPKHISEHRIIEAINPDKDVDGFHPITLGKLLIGEDTFKPCTPAGIQELLLRSGYDPAGKHVVIVGRSTIVGKPLAAMLVQKQAGANAIVTIVHTAAPDISYYTKQADILVAAMGKPESIHGSMIKDGAIVIDVGINRVEDPSAPKGYRIVGDVHFSSAAERAQAITPVPGGVGVMTVAMLMKNTLKAAYRYALSLKQA
ncbi:MAG: bifunctional methylenetetrahydrofolate dehydrogenase/methenyltetrahydrofolate cyclohydrolase FolD [Bacteroidetes bacterium]|nr:bifunctional methylenetetrahydrofolate dehydrogenase/methenyltetrahydrofolate cyclohydrolase FolD [Bacteroidota bacterium]